MDQGAHRDTARGGDDLERLRDFYHAFGLGFPPAGDALFGDGDTGEPGDWQVSRRGHKLGYMRASEVSTDELFALAPAWEIMRVVVHTFERARTKRGDVVTVGGHLYCRPRGSWGNERFAFLHIWTLCAGKALRFEDLLEGLELTRMGHDKGCSAA